MQKWKFVLGVLAGLAGVVLIAAFGATSAGTQPYKPDLMAAWIQAVGSVAAIGGVIWTVERQAKDSLKTIATEAEVTLRQKRLAAQSIVDIAMDRAEQIRETMKIQDVNEVRIELYRTYDRSILDGLVRALQGIPLHELGVSKAAGELLLFTDQITFLAIAIERFTNGPLNDPKLNSEIDRHLNGTQDERRIGRDMIATAIEAYRHNIQRHLDAMLKCYMAFQSSMQNPGNV